MRDDTLNEADLRHGLDRLAAAAVSSRDPLPEVFAGAAKIRRRRFLTAGLTVAAVGVGGFAARLLDRPELTLPAGNGPFLGWQTHGNAARSVVNTAIAAWERDRRGTHTGVQVLAAVTGTDIGSVVILQGYDEDGRPRLAFLTGTPHEPTGDGLWLRADRPAPRPDVTKAVSLVTPRLGPGVGQLAASHGVTTRPGSTPGSGRVYAVALAAPGVEHVRAYSTTIDQHVGEVGGPISRFQISGLDPDATALTTALHGYIEDTEVLRVPAWRGIGDPVPVPARVVDRPGAGVIVLEPATGRKVDLGWLVATPHGLVGRVEGVGDGACKVRLATAKGFRMNAHAAISGHTGVLVGTGDGMQFEAARGDLSDINRVLVDDPAQRGEATGAVTAGFVTGDRGGTTAAVRPAVGPDVTEVHVLTPAS